MSKSTVLASHPGLSQHAPRFGPGTLQLPSQPFTHGVVVVLVEVLVLLLVVVVVVVVVVLYTLNTLKLVAAVIMVVRVELELSVDSIFGSVCLLPLVG